MKNNKSLYSIEVEFLELENQLMENEGEITPEIEKALEINKDELNKKSGGYISVINKLSSEIDFIDAEVKRLQELKKVRKNAQNRLKNAIKDAMLIYDIDKIELPLNKISLRKSESVQITCDINDLPSDMKKIKVEAISKTEIKKMLKAGRVVEGVEIVENKNLQIK